LKFKFNVPPSNDTGPVPNPFTVVVANTPEEVNTPSVEANAAVPTRVPPVYV
jgi:hypothetical protein